MSTVGPSTSGLKRGAGEPLLNPREHVEGLLFLGNAWELVAQAHQHLWSLHQVGNH